MKFIINLILPVVLLNSCKLGTNSKASSSDIQKEIAAADSAKLCCKPPSRFAGINAGALESQDSMVYIEGAVYTMGTNDAEAYDAEKPAHSVKVNGFMIDVTEVTNEQYSKFVKATGYKTIAERKPEWEELKQQLPPGTPRPADDMLVPGSLVFIAPQGNVPLNDISNWWTWVKGADWKHPEGPGSSIEKRMNHPVVHIAYEDAVAYSKWVGKRLPTEAEWELAARGGLKDERYAWGSELSPGGKFMANTYQGTFPNNNTGADGFTGTAPVKQFPPNAFGLYDMIGNVWEITSDWFDANAYTKLGKAVSDNPKGPAKCNVPDNPYAIERVIKGGSYLCANNYCVNYRPSARQGSPYDSGSSNKGFRCVKDVATTKKL